MPIYSYFDHALNKPKWKGLNVLDFGGNHGNILLEPGSLIEHSQYTCLDVDPEPLEQGRLSFPKARWLHYNRYNNCYNRTGIKNNPLPEIGEKFDVITSYSVFTHTTENEMVSTVQEIIDKYLAKEGLFAFTFLTPPALSFFIDKRNSSGAYISVDEKLKWAEAKSAFSMTDDGLMSEDTNLEPEEIIHFLTFYKEDYILNLFKGLHLKLVPPPSGHLQSALVYQKES